MGTLFSSSNRKASSPKNNAVSSNIDNINRQITDTRIVCNHWTKIMIIDDIPEALINLIANYTYPRFSKLHNTGAEYQYVIKLIIIGDLSVGKSKILRRATDDVFTPDYDPTIAIDFGILTLKSASDNITYQLQVWDTSGNDTFRSVYTSYYRGCVGVFLVFDITNKDTLENINIWAKEFEENNCSEAVMILVGSKCDLKDDRKVSKEEAEELAKSLGCVEYIETSAKSIINTSYCFERMVENIRKRSDLLERKSTVMIC